MTDTDQKFSSQDIPLVAYLCACGHKILEQSERDSFNRITFVFQKNESLLKDLQGYQMNEPVPVQSYYRSLSFIWSLIRQEKKNGEN